MKTLGTITSIDHLQYETNIADLEINENMF
jgi:hypothetical protein